MSSSKTSSRTGGRRDFLKKSAAATFGFSVMPSYLALGRVDAQGNLPPSQRMNLGCIGVGGRARGVVPPICQGGHAVPVAWCDVDFSVGGCADNIKMAPKAKQFADFRVMLDEMGDDIDAVSVVTPDHTHFVAAMDAMRRGKHVYVEKPLTHSFREAQLLMDAEKKFGVVTQMGNQGHTSTGSEQFKHLVDQKIIHHITKIDAWKSPSLWFMEAGKRISAFPVVEPLPDTLNWDLWAGPKEMKAFSKKYHPFNWRAFYCYGNGMLGDWGAHVIDFPHDWLKMGLPTLLKALKMEDHNEVIFPLVSRLSMHFPERGKDLPACDIIWHDGHGFAPEVEERFCEKDGDGKVVQPNLGGAGTLLHRKDGEFLIQRGSHEGVSRILPREQMLKHRKDLKVDGPEFNHMESFTQACMGNGKTQSPFSKSGELTQVLLLGVICQYLNEDLEFDPATKRFKNHDRANELLDGPPPREGWKDFYQPL